MKNTPNVSLAADKTVRLRFRRNDFDGLRRHLSQDPRVEQFAFGLFTTLGTADGPVLLVRDLLLPGPNDLRHQSGGRVEPTPAFQALVYLAAEQQALSILDIHTHTHRGGPRLSGIDHAAAAKNADYITHRLPPPTTHAMLVFGNDLVGHDAVAYDRASQTYRPIAELEVLGRPVEIRPTGEDSSVAGDDVAQFDRQRRIPGWNQASLARQRIVIVGVGGNGAHVLQSLVELGAGEQGWIALVDPDGIEASNLPRLPYALPEDVGQTKVTVAARWARKKLPGLRCIPYPFSVTEKMVVDRVKGATMVVGAGDNDGVRKFCNDLAIRFNIPYIDLGCDIHVDADAVAAGGQVRVVLPGENACLVCCGGFDPAQAAIDLLDPEEIARRAEHGYVRDDRRLATPSVANLNALTAEFGVAALLNLVHGAPFGAWDYLHIDQLTGETLVARTNRRETCPVCGDGGVLGVGDTETMFEKNVAESWHPLEVPECSRSPVIADSESVTTQAATVTAPLARPVSAVMSAGPKTNTGKDGM